MSNMPFDVSRRALLRSSVWGTAWAVIAVWTALFSALAVRAYRRDTGRI